MGRIAKEGGTAPPGCDPAATDLANVCHVQITPGTGTDGSAMREALVAAFDRVTSAAIRGDQ
jgi:hypothetical protein